MPDPNFEPSQPEEVVEAGTASLRPTGTLNERGTARLHEGELPEAEARDGGTRALSSLSPDVQAIVGLATMGEEGAGATKTENEKAENPVETPEALIRGTTSLKEALARFNAMRAEHVADSVGEALRLAAKAREYDALLKEAERLVDSFVQMNVDEHSAPHESVVRAFHDLRQIETDLTTKKEDTEAQLKGILNDSNVAKQFEKTNDARMRAEQATEAFSRQMDTLAGEIRKLAGQEVSLGAAIRKQESAVEEAWEAITRAFDAAYGVLRTMTAGSDYGYRLQTILNNSDKDPDVILRSLEAELGEMRIKKEEGGGLLGKVRSSLREQAAKLVGEFKPGTDLQRSAIDEILSQRDAFDVSRKARQGLEELEREYMNISTMQPEILKGKLNGVLSAAAEMRSRISRETGVEVDDIVPALSKQLEEKVQRFVEEEKTAAAKGETTGSTGPLGSSMRNIFEKVTGIAARPREGKLIRPKSGELPPE